MNHPTRWSPVYLFIFFCTLGLGSAWADTAVPLPPLNEYGAVDVNAKVPLSAQIIEADESVIQPTVIAESTLFPAIVPSSPVINADGYLLMSANTGQVLAAHQPNKRLSPASLTKLMLVYVLQKELKLNRITLQDVVTVPKVAWATGGTRMFLKPGDKLSVRDLISGVLVASGNDAAVALAVHLGGTQEAFVAMMNHEAQRLGMVNTHFNNVMGLPSPAHYSSAYDLAVLTRQMITEFPEYLDWFGQKTVSYNGIEQQNYNKLLFRYQYAIGMKTGSTEGSGFSLVSAAKRPDHETLLIGVVLGASTRDLSVSGSQALLTYGFRFFKTQRLYNENQVLTRPRVLMAQEKTVAVGLAQPLDLTFPNVDASTLKSDIILKESLKAPIKKGEAVGVLQIKLGDKVLVEQPIVAFEDNPEGSMWQGIKDKMSLMFGMSKE